MGLDRGGLVVPGQQIICKYIERKILTSEGIRAIYGETTRGNFRKSCRKFFYRLTSGFKCVNKIENMAEKSGPQDRVYARERSSDSPMPRCYNPTSFRLRLGVFDQVILQVKAQ